MVVTMPICIVAAVGILVCDPGPVLYRARRMGRHGQVFTMHKFRSMRRQDGPRITAGCDPRVFWWGRVLRATKIDELPQLIDVLRGKMAIIGPRPEDPGLSAEIDDPRWQALLAYRPGLVSLGALLVYRIEHRHDAADPEAFYRRRVLPWRIKLDLDYFQRRTLISDTGLIAETIRLMSVRLCGKRGKHPDE